MELYKRNKTWWVGEGYNSMGVRIPRHTTKCRDQRAALKYVDSVVDKLTEWNGRKITPVATATASPEGLTLIEAMEKWLKKYDRRPSTQDQYRRIVRVETIDALAKLEPPITHLSAVRANHVNDLQEAWIARGLRLTCVLTYRGPSATMFNHFAKCEVIPRSPWRSITAPKELKPTIEEQVDDDAEVDTGYATLPLDTEGGDANWQRVRSGIIPFLLTKKFRVNQLGLHPENFLTYLELLYETGLRRGDAALFRPDKIRATANGGFSYKTKQIKTGEVVVCFLPVELAHRLRALPKLPWRGPKMKTAGMYPFWDGTNGLAKFKDYLDINISKLMCEAGESLGFHVKDGNTLRAHRFRDSFAINMLNGGMALHDVSRMLGHKNVQVTQNYYLRFVRSSQDALEARKYAARIIDYRAAEAAQVNEDAVIVN